MILLACAEVALTYTQTPDRSPETEPKKIAYFVDQAVKAGLRAANTFGGVDSKKFILETTGTGVAIFDYDNDGWPDIFVVNGTTLDPLAGKKPPTNHLYHNNHDGTFTDVTEKAGLAHGGWGQGVCVGDYDNDGYEDLFVTYYGKNVLYPNNGHRLPPEDVRKKTAAFLKEISGSACRASTP